MASRIVRRSAVLACAGRESEAFMLGGLSRCSDYIPKRGRSVHEATALHPDLAQATGPRPRRSRRSSLVLKGARRSARADRGTSRLLAIRLRYLADERTLRHLGSAAKRDGQRTGVGHEG